MSNGEGYDENKKNPYENKTPSTPSSGSPVNEGNIEITLEDDHPYLKDENVLQLGIDWTLTEITEKLGNVANLQLPTDSEREATIRDQVNKFFSTYQASNPPSTSTTLSSDPIERSSSASECVQSLNLMDFFSSRRTRKLRSLYRNSFNCFEDLMDPRSVNSLAYKTEMQIKYILFPLLRILLEDILDLVDFFEGTEVPQTCPIGVNDEELQLARVREEFESGVQEIEFDIIHNLENDFNGFVLRSPPRTNQDPLTLEIMPRPENKPVSPPRKKRRFDQQDPELDRVKDIRIHIKQLRSIQDVIESLVIIVISRSAEILNYCKETQISSSHDNIQPMISSINEQLHELKDLRKLCARLLAMLTKTSNPPGIMFILKVKVKTAIFFRGILMDVSNLIQSFPFQKEKIMSKVIYH